MPFAFPIRSIYDTHAMDSSLGLWPGWHGMLDH